MAHTNSHIQPTHGPRGTTPLGMEAEATHETQRVLQVPEQFVPGGWIIGAPTRLLDVWTATPLILRATGFRYPQHNIRFALAYGSSGISIARTHSLKRLYNRSARHCHNFGDSDLVFDCRHDSTGNIAHVLQNQIGVALHALRAFGMNDHWRDLVFVIREDTAEHSSRLFAALGLRTHKASGKVTGTLIRMSPPKFPLRSIASTVLREHACRIGILSDGDASCEPVFVSRQGRRTLSNISEVEPLINLAGYRTVYMENLQPEDQIRTVANAHKVWGLHGAGMAFIMFRNPSRNGVVIECFSSGFATNWARANAAATNSVWIGGQGEFDCKAIQDMQRGAHAHTHEADNYTLHPRTAAALAHLADTAACDPKILDHAATIDELLAIRSRGAGDGICTPNPIPEG